MHRIHSLDYLKLSLAVLVAFAHTYWLQTNMTPRLFMIGNGLMRVMVPTFCIVAGYFLYAAVARGKGRLWLWRVFVLYVFWMLVYLPFWLDDVHGVLSLAKTLVRGYFHLWFMAGILMAGVVVVALRGIGQRVAPLAQYRLMMLVAIVCAAIGVAMQYATLSGVAHFGVHRFSNGMFMCFPFVAIGYLCGRRVARCGIGGLPPRWLVLCAICAGAGLLMIEAWLVQARWGAQVMLDIPLSAYLAAPALFIAVLDTPMPQPPVRLDAISASIYFMHVMALQLAHLFDVTSLSGLMLFGAGLPTLIALALSRFPIPGLGKPRHRHGNQPVNAPSHAVPPAGSQPQP